MRKVILYGELGRTFGKEHHFSVRSASEAIQALCANFPGFRNNLQTAHRRGIGFQVFVGKSDLKRERDALLPSSNSDEIKIAPALLGAGGPVKALIGAVLIVAGAVIGTVASPFTAGASIPLGGHMIAIGSALLLNGVFEILSPPPKTPKVGESTLTEESKSFIFSGPENVSRQGGAVPVGYGRMMVGSTVISAGIEDADQ